MSRLSSWWFLLTVSILASCSLHNSEILYGTLTMGHEVRAFRPDGGTKEYWLIDKSGNLYKQYQEIAPIELGAYLPVNAELKLKKIPKMQDGFGAEYDGAYDVIEIISLTPIKNEV